MNELEQLRERYKKASSDDERESITKEAKLLKGELYQCYFVDELDNRCKNEQVDCWCSPEHKDLWQKKNYGIGRPRFARKLTIQEMQRELKQMGINAAKKKHI